MEIPHASDDDETISRPPQHGIQAHHPTGVRGKEWGENRKEIKRSPDDEAIPIAFEGLEQEGKEEDHRHFESDPEGVEERIGGITEAEALEIKGQDVAIHADAATEENVIEKIEPEVAVFRQTRLAFFPFKDLVVGIKKQGEEEAHKAKPGCRQKEREIGHAFEQKGSEGKRDNVGERAENAHFRETLPVLFEGDQTRGVEELESRGVIEGEEDGENEHQRERTAQGEAHDAEGLQEERDLDQEEIAAITGGKERIDERAEEEAERNAGEKNPLL